MVPPATAATIWISRVPNTRATEWMGMALSVPAIMSAQQHQCAGQGQGTGVKDGGLRPLHAYEKPAGEKPHGHGDDEPGAAAPFRLCQAHPDQGQKDR